MADPPTTEIIQIRDGEDALVHGIVHVFPDDASVDFLLLEVRIVCSRCGMQVVTIPGHHLPAVAEVLKRVIGKFPLQTGEVAAMPHPQGEA